MPPDRNGNGMIEAELERLRESDEVGVADREEILAFHEALTAERNKNNRCGDVHHRNVLRSLRYHAENTPDGTLADSLRDGEYGEAAVDELLAWFQESRLEYSQYTKQNLASSLRIFAQTVLEGDLPERFAEIEPGSFVKQHPAPQPYNVLEYDHLLKMIKAVLGTSSCGIRIDIRDTALLSTQWDWAGRPMYDLHPLQRKQIEFRDDEAIIHQEGGDDVKSDQKKKVLKIAHPALRRWVEEEHPAHHDPELEMGPDTYIWVNDDGELLEYGSMAERFRVAGDRADIDVDHSPQHFRRSAASILARNPFTTERTLRYRFDWSPNSDAPKHYIAMFSAQANDVIRRARGDKPESLDHDEDYRPIPCPTCAEYTMRGLEHCIWCRSALDADKISKPAHDPTRTPANAEQSLSDMILDGEVRKADLQVLKKLEGPIRRETDLWSKLDEYIERADALEDVFEDEDDGVVGAGVGALLGWIGDRAHRTVRSWVAAKRLALSLHPAYDYSLTGSPPLRPAAAILVFATVIGGVMAVTGLAQDLATGEPAPLIATALGLTIGSWQVARDMPTIDDAYAELRGQ